MIDVEFEPREAMRAATRDLVVRPDLLTTLPSVSRRPGGPTVVAAAAAVVGIAAAGVLLTGQLTGQHGGGRLAGAATGHSTSVDSLFGTWGPARGDRASDTACLRELASEWTAPVGRGRVAGFTPLVNPQGQLRLLWAADTPAGPAAVDVQGESQVPGESTSSSGCSRPAPPARRD